MVEGLQCSGIAAAPSLEGRGGVGDEESWNGGCKAAIGCRHNPPFFFFSPPCLSSHSLFPHFLLSDFWVLDVFVCAENGGVWVCV